ncbi:MAG: adenosylmethionine--8-amino-7-oxononanoate transaminase [Candidatus Omnitrophica bacterium CG11_big_fil_rev_8_21_14_0_20_42_13]|uniref:Adenosylmethionine-8-amino-7-oxononanoate aminotransferase n=1 Tax=Candidatus Ghiorseimicrobium undicola TaxID=1974746 RepID=A0A2H0LVE8_9BACT|nr:MAG: adenosylmethionine--8-amino-7-oxononanoate transaminase [Candidatus Omnitrophica bacterium CG11_big_fil_rev_8_21_14_0_20_42_13]
MRKNLTQLDKKYVWHPFTQMRDWLREDPLIVKEGRGVYLKDMHGRWFIDGVSSLWVNVHGHRNKEIDSAVKKQLGKIAHSTFLGLSHEKAILLARQLIGIVPPGLNKVFYSDNGSTSVEIALKMCFQYWRHKGMAGKTKFIYFNNSYHGDTVGSVSVGGINLFHNIYKPLLFGSYMAGFCEKKLETLLKRHHKKIAALIIEPLIQGAGGMLLCPSGFLKKARLLCSRYDILFIADEVATGFGRTGKMFACEHEKVRPDVMCLGKGITGGYLPLAATITSDKIYRAFLGYYGHKKTFFHGHSYTANPLACSAALANLKIFKKEKTLQKLKPKINYLKIQLKVFQGLKNVKEVRQLGFMVGIELIKNKKAGTPYHWEERIGLKVVNEARKRGAILRPLGNVIVLMPALNISMNTLKKLLKITYQSIVSATGNVK